MPLKYLQTQRFTACGKTQSFERAGLKSAAGKVIVLKGRGF
jgi:hypothetical protein